MSPDFSETVLNKVFIEGVLLLVPLKFWGEVTKRVVRHFSNIFFFLKNEGFLDPLNEVPVFALSYIYMARINKALEDLSND